MKFLPVLALAVGAAAIPAIPSDYSCGQQNELLVNQNTVPGPDGDVCCALNSNCKLQVEANSGTFYNSFTLQKTKFNVPGGGYIISDFADKPQRQYTVQLQQGGGEQCTYCPNEGNVTKDFMPSNAKDIGQVMVDGKPLEHWQWGEYLIVIQMELIDTYVNQKVSPPIPTQQNVTITPFGQYLGEETTTFLNWQTGPQKASEFTIPSGCTYGGDQSCNNDSTGRLAKYALSKAKTKPMPLLATNRLKASASSKASNNVPVFPSDWSAIEENFMVENQGGIAESGDLECCTLPGECKIQTSYDLAKHYYSVKNNAERFDDKTQGVVIVYNYTAGKGIQATQSASGVLTCQNYCPIGTQTLTPFGIQDGMVDQGMHPYKGKNYNMWVVNQTGPFNITMETDTLYIDQSGASPVPVFYEADITPFGIKLAKQTQDWTDFVGGEQKASLFQVEGLATCPEASNCGQQMWQNLRLRTKDFNGYFKHKKLNEAI